MRDPAAEKKKLSTACTVALVLAALVMIGIPVIAIVVAIALPAFVYPRSRANEASAVASLKNIAGAQAVFISLDSDEDGDDDYGSIDELVDSDLLIDDFRDSPRQGYIFAVNLWQEQEGSTSIPHFSATAEPVEKGVDGDLFFYVDESGLVRSSETGPAGPEDEAWN